MSSTTIATSGDDRRWTDWAVGILEREARTALPTPLWHLCLPIAGIDILIKDESGNPTGSTKDRLARELLLAAICSGQVGRRTVLVEASSGSTAISEARLALGLGLPFVAVVPHGTAPAKLELIRGYGGECHLVAPGVSIYDEAMNVAADRRGHYVDQFTNAAGMPWRGDDTLPAELAEQMAVYRHPVPRWVVCGAGTGGTATQFIRHSRLNGRHTRVCVADPPGGAFYSGWCARSRAVTTSPSGIIEGIGRPRVEPSFPPFGAVDLSVQVPDAASIATIRELRAWNPRLHLGGATGTALWVALDLACRMRDRGERGSIVSIAGDAGARYADTYYNDRWILEHDLDLAPYTHALRVLKATGRFVQP